MGTWKAVWKPLRTHPRKQGRGTATEAVKIIRDEHMPQAHPSGAPRVQTPACLSPL